MVARTCISCIAVSSAVSAARFVEGLGKCTCCSAGFPTNSPGGLHCNGGLACTYLHDADRP